MSKFSRLALPALLILGSFQSAHAVPSFARQTGLSCNVCHTNPPELTQFGRNFKLRGYVLTSPSATDKVGNASNLSLTKNIPISFMALLSNSATQATQPGTQNNSAGFPQQLSIFLAGAFATHFGGMAQVTYTHSDDHFGMDNTDLRYANHGTVGGKGVDYGITLNNNPTVQDLWNSTPAWGFPWISSATNVGPLAGPVIAGALGQDVAGLGGYAMWNDHLYTEMTLYRSEHGGAAAPVTGQGQSYNISGAAPYWRAGWQQTWGANYLMVGTYGMYMKSFPNAISGPEDSYVDPSLDFQYERPIGANFLDVHGTWIHEKSTLDATYAGGGATAPDNHLNTLRLDSTYHWRNRYTATGALFSTTGNSDALLYAPAAVTGSQNGNPDTSGYVAQFAYWPMQNIDLNVSYTGYTKFNGATTNYDGANRNASDNNTVYMALWLNF
ncbi:MAG: cytochrome C [Acidobacteriota bacterium]